MKLGYDTYVDAVEREAASFVGALRAGPLDVMVPSCPAWALAELAMHVGQFCGFWAHVLCEGTGRPKTPAPAPPPEAERADWFAEQAGNLVGELHRTSADTEVWTWVDDDHTAAFVARRAAHELAVHRFDAQLARAVPEPIDAGLAADGIEEIFVMIANWAPPEQGQGETLHLHGTDHGDEWLLTLGPQRLDVDRVHAEADLALSGAVSDLELVLYQRPPIGAVERVGHERVISTWHRTFTFG